MARLVFSADDGSNGRELWGTDGTEAGTRLLADIWPGGGPSNPSSLASLGDGRVVFAAADPSRNVEPWVTDGTAAGTRLVLDVNTASSGFASSFPGRFAVLDDGRALFTASDLEHGTEPWVTDSTAQGTRLLETRPGPEYAYLSAGFVPLGDGRALFGAGDPERGSELWVTDGTPSGTALVADINPGPNGSFPGDYSGAFGMLALGDGRAVFSADDGANGRELWISDGTGAGTRLLADIWPGAYSPYPGSGDVAGSGAPGNFTDLGNGRTLFAATDPNRGTELWTTDGTTAGTRIVADLWTGTSSPYPGAAAAPAGSNPGSILALGGGRAVFAADDGARGRELWATDGTEAGTVLVADLWAGGGSGNPGGGGGYASAPPPYGGRPSGPGGGPGGIVALGDGRALFSGTDPEHGNELWITDGTPAGTRLVEDINRDAQGFANSVPSLFAALGDGRAVFSADDGENGLEPWISDGTAEGTRPLRDVAPGALGSGPSGFVGVGAGGETHGTSTDGWFAG